jgi:hypothetical protein
VSLLRLQAASTTLVANIEAQLRRAHALNAAVNTHEHTRDPRDLADAAEHLAAIRDLNSASLGILFSAEMAVERLIGLTMDQPVIQNSEIRIPNS